MATISKAELREDIAGILKDADLSKLSAKKVRRTLEEIHDTDLTDRKEEIDGLVMEAIKSQEEEEDLDEANGGRRSSASESESDFDQPIDMGPKAKKPKVTKVAKKKKKENSESEEEKDDEELAKKLQDEENTRSGRRTRFFKSTKPTPSSQKKTKSAKGEKGATKRKSGYVQPCQLSPLLADLMGTDTLARSDVVKKMWEIIKERDLYDPKNKQFMLCDAELHKIFGRKRVRTFGMMKYLKDHIWNPEEVI